jgi:hypothetical protein
VSWSSTKKKIPCQPVQPVTLSPARRERLQRSPRSCSTQSYHPRVSYLQRDFCFLFTGHLFSLRRHRRRPLVTVPKPSQGEGSVRYGAHHHNVDSTVLLPPSPPVFLRSVTKIDLWGVSSDCQKRAGPMSRPHCATVVYAVGTKSTSSPTRAATMETLSFGHRTALWNVTKCEKV